MSTTGGGGGGGHCSNKRFAKNRVKLEPNKDVANTCDSRIQAGILVEPMYRYMEHTYPGTGKDPVYRYMRHA